MVLLSIDCKVITRDSRWDDEREQEFFTLLKDAGFEPGNHGYGDNYWYRSAQSDPGEMKYYPWARDDCVAVYMRDGNDGRVVVSGDLETALDVKTRVVKALRAYGQ